jgi:Lon protease-like protein
MQPTLLPLFPLPVVLFPGAPLPLHIFEERYQQMFAEVLRSNSEFGVVLAQDKGIVSTGCTALVERVVERYADGRLDLIASGRRRFEIQALDQELAYLRGEVRFFDDEDDAPVAEETRSRVLELAHEMARLQPPETPPVWTARQVSFQVAQLLTDLNVRQVLLANRSENDRLRQLAELLPSLVTKLGFTQHIQTVAPQNGHAKHNVSFE